MNNLKVTMMPVDSIIPYENNPRKNDDAVKYVANSIREFGFRSPIIVDSDNVIICGHTRAKSALSLGLTEVPVHVAEDLTDEQVKALRLADNKTGEKSFWDWAKLELELEEIDWLDMNMEDFGFSLPTSVLDVLGEEEIIGSHDDPEATEFAMTFIFPIEARSTVEGFVKENGKDHLVRLILSEVGYGD